MISELRRSFDVDGFVVLRGLLDADEVASLRVQAHRGLDESGFGFGRGTVLIPAMVSPVPCRPIFTHPRILEAVRDVLGVDQPVFTMDAGIHRNVTSPWHKDTGEHLMPQGYFGVDEPTADPDCRIVRVGIYLQEHLDGTALNVRRGSHVIWDTTSGEHVPLEIHPGDVILCNVLTTHRGVFPTRVDDAVESVMRLIPRRRRAKTVAHARRLLRSLAGRDDRVAIFFAFGVPGVRTETYGSRTYHRELDQMSMAPHEIDADLRADLEQAGVSLLQEVAAFQLV
jgi:hypothetical protein